MRTEKSVQSAPESGSVAVFVALLLPVLIGVLALVLDGGFLFDVKRKMQGAADSAAVTAAWEAKRGTSSSTVIAAARSDSAKNDFTHGADSTAVTVNLPPTTGTYAGRSHFAEVVITQPRTPFLPIFGGSATTVTARAVAGTSESNICLLALAPSGSSTLVVSGGGALNLGSRCEVVDNSSTAAGLTASGGSCITAGQITVTGSSATGGCLSPSASTNVPPTPDPFSDLVAPSTAGCAHSGFTGCADNATECKVQGTTATLHPGVYCGGILLKGGAQVTMEPGVYALPAGQDFTISQNTTVVSGSGVTIYLAAGSGKFTASGGPTVNLAAPRSGDNEAMLFFQDPGNSSTVTFSGGASTSLEGVIYAKNSKVVFSGGSTSTAPYTVIVSNTMTFSGGSTLGGDFSVLADGSPIKRVALAE